MELPYKGPAEIAIDNGDVFAVTCSYGVGTASGDVSGATTPSQPRYVGIFDGARADLLDRLRGAKATLKIPDRAEERIQILEAKRSHPDGTVWGHFEVLFQDDRITGR